MAEITERILEILKIRKMSQKEFCEKIGIAQSTFANWKKRQTDPQASLILPIAKTLDVSLTYLLLGNEEEQDTNIHSKFKELMVYDPVSRYYDRCSEEGKKEIAKFAEYASERWKIENK